MITPDLRQHLEDHDQAHLLRFEHQLDAAARATLAAQLRDLDLPRLRRLYHQAKAGPAAIEHQAIEPIDTIGLPRHERDWQEYRRARQAGEEALCAGRVAAVLVAGGQGTRLGFDAPKGMFSIGPVSGASLFRIFAEKIRAWCRRAQQVIPWCIMTSAATHEQTEAYFREHHFWGLSPDQVRFFQQGTMPAVDANTGKVLLAKPGELFLSPNGHGGTLWALRDHGLLAEFAERGIDLLYYFQVDNPLAQVLDPAYLGYHLLHDADLSVKVVPKRHPQEKVGVVTRYQGKPTILEYSDLTPELRERANERGELLLGGGNTAIHVFSRPFLERAASGELEMPFHFAHKVVPHVDETGVLQEPQQPNAIKFEMFIFDLLPLARHVNVVETSREVEFAPVKNARGADSPEEARAAMTRLAANWLRSGLQRMGKEFLTTPDNDPALLVEVSPLVALDEEEFRRWLQEHPPETFLPLTAPLYFAPPTEK